MRNELGPTPSPSPEFREEVVREEDLGDGWKRIEEKLSRTDEFTGKKIELLRVKIIDPKGKVREIGWYDDTRRLFRWEAKVYDDEGQLIRHLERVCSEAMPPSPLRITDFQWKEDGVKLEEHSISSPEEIEKVKEWRERRIKGEW